MNFGRFHCCGTCTHFRVEKDGGGTIYKCDRLQYETKPTYQFRCWQPKEHIIALMKKELTTNKKDEF